MCPSDEKQKRKRRTKEEIAADKQKLLVGYYAMHYAPEYYTCINNFRPNIPRPKASLDEKHVREYVRKATSIGIEEYIWRTCKDKRVCSRCASYEGKKFSYDTMPPGGHPCLAAGCRCYAEPVIDINKLKDPEPIAVIKPRKKSRGSLFKMLYFFSGIFILDWIYRGSKK
jgi:hypothetical protein